MIAKISWIFLICIFQKGLATLPFDKEISSAKDRASSTDLLCNLAKWNTEEPKCAGKKQSPINIITKSLKMDGSYSKLVFNNYDKYPTSAELVNKDYSFKYDATYKSGEVPTITGGVLGDKVFQFLEWHCHWSNDNEFGSEHTFNGQSYPIECHFVHFNQKYGNALNALGYSDGLAVLGYVYRIRYSSTFPASTLGPAIMRLRETDHASIEPLPLSAYAPEFSRNYITYSGSLTTPTCNEAVTWIVNAEAQKISKGLLKRFRYIARNSKCMVDNFRPTQPVNGREVTFVRSRFF